VNKTPRKIVIASGKGGTGKTSITTSLSMLCSVSASYADCDVEEPNGFLYLKPEIYKEKTITKSVPALDSNLCEACGTCSKNCKFHAIASIKTRPLIFPEMCHGCGLCIATCPTGALYKSETELGTISYGKRGTLECIEGRLRLGEPMSPPLISQVLKAVDRLTTEIAWIDAPPGNSCPLVESVSSAHMVILVVEPTPFGFHDFHIAYNTVSLFTKNIFVVINRAYGDYSLLHDFCKKEQIPILAKIPLSKNIASELAKGKMLHEISETKSVMQHLSTQILSRLEEKS
jgi:MinD superfamily P-loop ATPase